jgi:hypothetical protein
MRIRRMVAATLLVTLSLLAAVALAPEDPAPTRSRVAAPVASRDRPSIGGDPAPTRSSPPAGSVGVRGAAGAGAIVAARHALAAWGRFAVSRELGEVQPWFAADGPQYGRFRAEAAEPGPAPGPPSYRVSFAPWEVAEVRRTVRVRAEVVFVRTGEPSQRFHWWVIMRPAAGGWKVWTVEAVGAPPGPEAEDRLEPG